MNEEKPVISVVVVSRDRAATLRYALESLIRQEIGTPFEVVVVDDGSTDETAAVVLSMAARVGVALRLLQTDGVGIPAARNVGAGAALGRWIASLDDDQIASPSWLAAMWAAKEATGARCFGGALTLALPETVPGDQLGPRARGLLGEHLLGNVMREYPRDVFPAARNAMVERRLLLAASGFDESFTQGGSDTEFFRRLKKMGEPLWFVPGAAAEHLIPECRVRAEHLRWSARTVAVTRVKIFVKERRWMAMARFLAGRQAVTLTRDWPGWVVAKLKGDRAGALDARCSLWFSFGTILAAWAQMRPQAKPGFPGSRPPSPALCGTGAK